MFHDINSLFSPDAVLSPSVPQLIQSPPPTVVSLLIEKQENVDDLSEMGRGEQSWASNPCGLTGGDDLSHLPILSPSFLLCWLLDVL